MTKEKALFPGCLITSRFPEYELSSQQVLKAIGVKTHVLPELMCCGQVLQGVTPSWIYMAAYNLALAEQYNMDLITLCGGCTNTLKRAQYMCRQDPGMLVDVNQVLSKVGIHFKNTVKVQHLLEVLYEHRSQTLACFKKVVPVKAAVMNPCQVFRPAAIMQFDDQEHPHIMEDLLRPVVADIIPYSFQDHCCGASLSMSSESAAYQIGRARLQELESKHTDVLITACGNCQLLLSSKQSSYYHGRQIPCLFLPQILGIAMGFTPQELLINESYMRSLNNGE